jgi:hypothetical protein
MAFEPRLCRLIARGSEVPNERGRMGRGVKAQEHLTTARAMYREMGMAFWLEKAEMARAGGDP